MVIRKHIQEVNKIAYFIKQVNLQSISVIRPDNEAHDLWSDNHVICDGLILLLSCEAKLRF